jgi:hypothetical protein
VPLLEAVENAKGIRYVRCGRSDTDVAKCYSTVTALPDLGKASAASAVNCTTFLICHRTEVIRARDLAGPVYVFDQLLNPNAVTFTPGGLWGDDILLHGRFASVSNDAFSAELLRLVRSLIRKQFKKIKAFYVGQAAERMLDSGKRLTMAVQSPRTFDLSRT